MTLSLFSRLSDENNLRVNELVMNKSPENMLMIVCIEIVGENE